jgi:hypothetical protein
VTVDIPMDLKVLVGEKRLALSSGTRNAVLPPTEEIHLSGTG